MMQFAKIIYGLVGK